MRFFKKAATSMAAVGLLAFGLVAGSGSSAFATTGNSVTGCDATLGALAIGLFPNCTAGTSTINNPTSVTITVNTTSLGALLNILPLLGEKATWDLTCVVGGSAITVPGSYTVNSGNPTASTTINLQNVFNSPEPTSCTISNLKVTTTLSLSILALGLNPITIGVNATANTAVPGAVYASYPKDSVGALSSVCADDTDNANAGSAVQAFQCLSDLADFWVQIGTGQFVHNGLCMTDTSGSVTLAQCIANPGDGSGQIWNPENSTGAGLLANADGNGCLIAPSSGTINGVPLRVGTCHSGTLGQEWTVPPVTVT
jgi:hypothetical protein